MYLLIFISHNFNLLNIVKTKVNCKSIPKMLIMSQCINHIQDLFMSMRLWMSVSHPLAFGIVSQFNLLILFLFLFIFLSLLTRWILRTINLSLRWRRHLGSKSAAEYTFFFLFSLFLLLASNGLAENRSVLLWDSPFLIFFLGNGTKSADSIKLFIFISWMVGLRRRWTVSDSEGLWSCPAWATMVASTATSDGTWEGSIMERDHFTKFGIG